MKIEASLLLYRRISLWRWCAPIIALVLVFVHQLIEHTWLAYLPHWQHFASQIVFYGLIGPAMAWWALTSLRRSVLDAHKAERALHRTHQQLTSTNEQLALLLRINRSLADVDDEETLYNTVLEITSEITSAIGCSFFRFDERQRPLPALHYGSLDETTFELWSTQLTEAHYCQRCACHGMNSGEIVNPCAVFQPDTAICGVGQIYCLLMTRGNHSYGAINIYLPTQQTLTAQQLSLLEAVAQEVSLVLESYTLRAREMGMLRRLQQANQSPDLNNKLTRIIQPTVEALQIEGGALFLPDTLSDMLRTVIKVGDWNSQLLEAIEQLINNKLERKPVLHNLTQGIQRIVLITPVCTEDDLLGHLVLYAKDAQAFTNRRIQLIDIVAGQIALLIDNYRLDEQAKHQAILNERARLAREIHDGLAQSLAYLKLRVSQLRRWFDQGENERTQEGLNEVHHLLHATYVDAREAIDGLHLHSNKEDIGIWLVEAISEFETFSGLAVSSRGHPEVVLSQEVQTQLQRIIQEAFSNIRKHANASAVQLTWQTLGDRLVLEICDDGCGFDVRDVPPVARHGLLVMQERAELINANFQIMSTVGQGTRITLDLPLLQTGVIYG